MIAIFHDENSVFDSIKPESIFKHHWVNLVFDEYWHVWPEGIHFFFHENRFVEIHNSDFSSIILGKKTYSTVW